MLKPLARKLKNTMDQQFLQDLTNEHLHFVVQKWLVDRVPFVFDANWVKYVKWKSSLSSKIFVDGKAIVIIGSASTGFSLSPTKNFRKFDDKSDIDIAIISAHHFELAWHAIRTLGAKDHRLNPAQRSSLEDHRKRLIYWGAFDTKHLLAKLPFRKDWFEAFENMTSLDPTRDREINARIYRNFESLTAYHVNNFTELREQQLKKLRG